MPFLQRVALFGFIVFFSGSVVVVAARNLRDKLGGFADKDKERAEKLIHALQGDELFRLAGKYSDNHTPPARQGRSYLPDHDRKKIKEFLKSLIGSGQPESTQETK